MRSRHHPIISLGRYAATLTLGSCLSWVPYFGNASALGLHLTLDALCHLHKCHYTMSMGRSDTAHTSAPSKKSHFGILLDGQAQEPVHWGSHIFYLFPLIPNGLSFLPPTHLHFSPTYPFPFTSLPLTFPFFHPTHHAITSPPLALASSSPSSPLLFLPLRHQQQEVVLLPAVVSLLAALLSPTSRSCICSSCIVQDVVATSSKLHRITSNSCVVHPSPPTIAMSIQPHFFHFCNHCNHCVCMKARGKAREGKGYMFNLIP